MVLKARRLGPTERKVCAAVIVLAIELCLHRGCVLVGSVRADIACSSDVALLAFLLPRLARRNPKRRQVVQVRVRQPARARLRRQVRVVDQAS